MGQKLILIFLLCPFGWVQAQHPVQGKVTDRMGHPLAYVAVAIPELGSGTFTDEKGTFEMVLPHSGFLLELSSVGYKIRRVRLDSLKRGEPLIIVMEEDLLELSEITVTAKKTYSREGTSSYKIGSQAIKQVQAMSLADVLGLLPGNKVSPPDLDEAQRASLRTAAPSSAGSFGTAIIVDGMALNNDANMQAKNPSSSMAAGEASVATGIDLRRVSLTNVASVEVVSGVASPKYGNLSSGGIIVKSKVGKSPWTISTNAAATNYQVAVAKGSQLPGWGVLNSDFSYSYSSGSPTERKTYYQQFNAGLRWKTPVPKGSDWNHFTSLRIVHADDGNRHEPDEIYKNEADVKSTSYRLGLSGDFGTAFLGKVSYHLGGNVAFQHSFFDTFHTNGPFPIIEATESGTYATTYAPAVYQQTKDIRGRPLHVDARLENSQHLALGPFGFSFNTGLQYSYDKNTGRGRVATGNIAHIADVVGSRSATFQQIPASKTFSAYHETRIKREGEASLQRLNLGLRYDNMLVRYHLFSPRLSFSSDQKSTVLRASWGISYKAPAMLQLYPGKTFIDYINFAYYAENPKERLAMVTTYVHRPTNRHLKPSYGDIKEVGFDWSPDFLKLKVTLFKKGLHRGIYHSPELRVLPKQLYRVTAAPSDMPPTVVPIPGGVDKVTRNISVLKNNYSVATKGVEVTLSPRKIKATNTEFHFRFSHLESSEKDTGYSIKASQYVIGDARARFGVYENPEERHFYSMGTLTAIQHIPSLRFVLTLAAELHFQDYKKTIGGSLYPYAYYDPDGDYHPIPPTDRGHAGYQDLKLPERTYTTLSKPPFYTNYNLQIRKETRQGHSFSFFASNAPWHNPVYEYSGSRRKLNGKLSVGFASSILIK